ncbi:hypothetical protein ACFL6S_21575 [Candidatus Poribacteria bacterium]
MIAAFSILDKVVVSDKAKAHPSKEIRQGKIREHLEAMRTASWQVPPLKVDNIREQLIEYYGKPKKTTEMGGFLHYLYPEKGVLFSLRGESVISWTLWFDLE